MHSIGGDVAEGDEETPLNEKDTSRREGEDAIVEHGPVRPEGGRSRFRGQTRSNQNVGNEE